MYRTVVVFVRVLYESGDRVIGAVGVLSPTYGTGYGSISADM